MNETIGTEKDYDEFLESQRNNAHHISYGDKREVFKRYQTTLDAYANTSIEVGNLKKMINQFEYDLKAKESKHMYAVTHELDAGNTPKFKNAESRKSELNSRLRADEEYKKLYDMLEDTKDQLLSGELKLDSLRKHLKFYEVSMNGL